MIEAGQYLIYGFGAGGLLLLSTIGFTLVRQVDGFLNIAHAELIAFSAFAGWWLNVKQGWTFVPAALTAIALTVALSMLLRRWIFAPMRDYGHAILLIASVGAAFALQGAIEILAGVGIFSYRLPLRELLTVGPFQIDTFEAGIFVLAIATTVLIHLMLDNTRAGRRLRAVAVNPGLAENRGISRESTSSFVWAISGLTAGMAGVCLATVGTLTTDMAFQQILLIVAVAIFAGFGTLLELSVAALLIGISMKMSLLLIPSSYQNAVPFAIIFLVLLIRPQGLRRERVA